MIQVFLSGDVMTGRGIDQILAHPSDPIIYESYVKDARDYVSLAERTNGAIVRKVPGSYLWGDGLIELEKRDPHARIINLETSITQCTTPWPQKGINYRMHPDNIDALLAAKINICALSNNHILDWMHEGAIETIATLDSAKILHAGFGMNTAQAQAPAILPLIDSDKRILLFSLGLDSSGIPQSWAASATQAGLWYLEDLNSNSLEQVRAVIDAYRLANDICIVSIHWGGNWGYDVTKKQQWFAYSLIDDLGVNVVHAHSSHHPKGIELHHHCPILYGCGDLINDYEGIGGHDEYRSELSLMYFLSFDDMNYMKQLELVPVERKNFRLNYVKDMDAQWLTERLSQVSADFHTRFEFSNGVIYCY